VVVAWKVFVVLTIIVGVIVIKLVLVKNEVDGARVIVFPTTPSCLQALEYDFRSRHDEAYSGTWSGVKTEGLH
jgi:hypothetical protein